MNCTTTLDRNQFTHSPWHTVILRLHYGKCVTLLKSMSATLWSILLKNYLIPYISQSLLSHKHICNFYIILSPENTVIITLTYTDFCLQPGCNDPTTVQLVARSLPWKQDKECLRDEPNNIWTIWMTIQSFCERTKPQYVN